MSDKRIYPAVEGNLTNQVAFKIMDGKNNRGYVKIVTP